MRHKYCCDKLAYERYYAQQAGGGLPYFAGARYQTGSGLGSVLASIGRTLLPLVKSGAKTLGKHALKSGVTLAGDVIQGKNFKKSAVKRTKELGVGFFNDLTTSKKRKKSKRVKKKPRTVTRDIFS